MFYSSILPIGSVFSSQITYQLRIYVLVSSALVAAFEKAKKKYQSKLKKMETQLRESSEQYENQVSHLKLVLTCDYIISGMQNSV